MKVEIKNKEVDLVLEYDHLVGSRPRVSIYGSGDLSHHLIEGLFDIVDKLARMESCSHRKEEYIG